MSQTETLINNYNNNNNPICKVPECQKTSVALKWKLGLNQNWNTDNTDAAGYAIFTPVSHSYNTRYMFFTYLAVHVQKCRGMDFWLSGTEKGLSLDPTRTGSLWSPFWIFCFMPFHYRKCPHDIFRKQLSEISRNELECNHKSLKLVC